MKEIKRYKKSDFLDFKVIYAKMDVSTLYAIKEVEGNFRKWIDVYIFMNDLGIDYLLDYFKIELKEDKIPTYDELVELVKEAWEKRIELKPQLKKALVHKIPIIEKKRKKKVIVGYGRAKYDDLVNGEKYDFDIYTDYIEVDNFLLQYNRDEIILYRR